MLSKDLYLIFFVYFKILCNYSIGASIPMSLPEDKTLLVLLRFDAETESLSSSITVFLSISTEALLLIRLFCLFYKGDYSTY